MKKIGLFILTNGFLGILFCIAINISSTEYIREYFEILHIDNVEIGIKHLLIFFMIALFGLLIIGYSEEKNL